MYIINSSSSSAAPANPQIQGSANKGRLYLAAKTYNQACDITSDVASTTFNAVNNTVQVGSAFVKGSLYAINNPKESIKNALYYSFGGNNLSDAAEAMRKQDYENFIDNRSFPQRLGEATSNAGIAVSKATLSGLLAIGTLSHFVPGIDQNTLAEYPTISIAHSMADAAWNIGALNVSFWSNVAETVSPYAYSMSSQIASMSYSATKTVMAHPEMLRNGLVVGATLGSLKLATSNYVKAVDADNLSDKIKYGTAAAAATLMSVAIPVFTLNNLKQ